jgi:shikimate 5-dehydrogenase
MSDKRRGRPALDWLDAAGISRLPVGTAIALEQHGKHAARTRGRILAAGTDSLRLSTPRGEVTVTAVAIKRGRVVDAVYEPGDPVLLRHVPAAKWRGGVVRSQGSEVLVEQIDGSFAWFTEADLEPAEARDGLPALPRGPVAAAR